MIVVLQTYPEPSFYLYQFRHYGDVKDKDTDFTLLVIEAPPRRDDVAHPNRLVVPRDF